MSSDYDDSSSSGLTALAAAASKARSDASNAGTPRQQDSDNTSISSVKSCFISSNDDASSCGPVIARAKIGNVSNDESAKTIGALLKKADAASNHGSKKRKSQNYSSDSDTDDDGNGDDDDESEEFLISRIPKPKRPMTAYNFFFQAERKKIIHEEEGASKTTKSMSSSSGTCRKNKTINHQAAFENMGKTIGRRWKEVNNEDLERYQALGAKESRRYRREMKVYNAKVASIRAKKSIRAEAKKTRREIHSETRNTPSSASSITDTNTTATASLSAIGTRSDQGDDLTSFINSLSQDQLTMLLRLRDKESKLAKQASLRPLSVPLQSQSILAQASIDQFQSASLPPAGAPASLLPASSSQHLSSISSMERALIHSQGKMIAQLQAQVQALQRQQFSQPPLPSLPSSVLHRQQQQNGQIWSNNSSSATIDTGMRLPTNAPLRSGIDTSRITAALSSRYSGKPLAGQQQQANLLKGNVAPGNNISPLFFSL